MYFAVIARFNALGLAWSTALPLGLGIARPLVRVRALVNKHHEIASLFYPIAVVITISFH